MSPEKIPTRTRLALAQKLRFLRFTRGWSQEVLAELAGSRSRLPGRSCASCACDISASLHVSSRDISAYMNTSNLTSILS